MKGIVVKNLRVQLPTYAISSDDFDVPSGTFLTLDAPSGFGKTTLLRAIMGFQKAPGLEIRLNGKRIDDLPPYQREMGVVFQDHLLFPNLSAWENAVFGLSLRKRLDPGAILRSENAFSALGLRSRMHAPIHELSGGERQRVAILRATLFHPECLILDEPLKGLDPESIAKVVTYLKEHVSMRNVPVIWISHQGADVFAGGRIIGTEQNGIRHFRFTRG